MIGLTRCQAIENRIDFRTPCLERSPASSLRLLIDVGKALLHSAIRNTAGFPREVSRVVNLQWKLNIGDLKSRGLS